MCRVRMDVAVVNEQKRKIMGDVNNICSGVV